VRWRSLLDMSTAGQIALGERNRLVAVLAKAEASHDGRLRGYRHPIGAYHPAIDRGVQKCKLTAIAHPSRSSSSARYGAVTGSTASNQPHHGNEACVRF
jgi:hypothetical protein